VSGTGEVLLGPFRVLGTASPYVARRMGNPDHDRMLPFGDPPSGRYVIASSLAPGSIHPRRPGRFGKLGALLLEPTSGEGLAAKARGRDHIVLHGGPRDKKRRLRRTRGGLRIANGRLSALLSAINQAQRAGDPVSLVEIKDVSAGFWSDEAPLPPAEPRRRRRRRHLPAGSSAMSVAPGVAIAAMAAFGVAKASPTRRSFLATALLAVAGGRLLAACGDDRPASCIRTCRDEYGSDAGTSGREIGSGSGSGSRLEQCIQQCEDDYGSGGGVG